MNGRDLKTAGQQLALFNAGDWTDTAIMSLKAFCASRKESGQRVFKFEDFRESATSSGLPIPSSHKVWGALPRIAIRLGLIAWTGQHAPSRSAKTHGHYVKTWMAL